MIDFISSDVGIKTIIIIIALIAIEIIAKILTKRGKIKIYTKFFKSLLECFLVIIELFILGNQIPEMKEFSTTILASSGLLVVVIGFAFQEALSNVVHGIIIVISKPFDIRDRISIPSLNLSGTIETINIRHTVVKNVITSAAVIIPNSIMNTAVIENSYFENNAHTHFVDITIGYDSDIDKAISVISEVVKNNQYIIDSRTPEDKKNNVPQISITCRELTQNGAVLRTRVTTKTVEDNFKACSEIRIDIVKALKEEGITIPTQLNTIKGSIDITNIH